MKKKYLKPIVGKSYTSKSHVKLLVVDWCREKKNQKSPCDLEKILSELKTGLTLDDIAHYSFLTCLMDDSFTRRVNDSKAKNIGALCLKSLNDDDIYESRKNFKVVVNKLMPDAILFVGNSLTKFVNIALRGFIDQRNNLTNFLQDLDIRFFDYYDEDSLKDLRNLINGKIYFNPQIDIANLMASVHQLVDYYLEKIQAPLFYNINGSLEYLDFRGKTTDRNGSEICPPDAYIDYAIEVGNNISSAIREMDDHYTHFLKYYNAIENSLSKKIVFKKNIKQAKAANHASHAALIKGEIRKSISKLKSILNNHKETYKDVFFLNLQDVLSDLKKEGFNTSLSENDHKAYPTLADLIDRQKIKDQKQIVIFLSLCRKIFFKTRMVQARDFNLIIKALEIFLELPIKQQKT